MTEPVSNVKAALLGQAKKPNQPDLEISQRANRLKRREIMASIDDCKKLSDTIESKFGELNLSLTKVSVKFDDLTKQYEKVIEIFNKNTSEISQLKQSVDDKDKRISELEMQMDSVKERVQQCEEKYGDRQKQFALHTEMLMHHNDQFDKLDHESKAHPLIIKNLTETDKSPREDIDDLFTALKIDLKSEKDCDKIFRIGKPQKQNNNYPRPIMVQLVKTSHKGVIFSSIVNLRGSNMARVIIDNDQGSVQQRQSGNLRAVAAVAKTQGMNARVKQGKVIVNGTPYFHDKLDQLPTPIALPTIKTIEIPDVGICYQGEYSPLSNMFASEIHYDDEIYKTAEHALIGTRAKVEGNLEMEAMVKFTRDPFLVKLRARRWDESQTWQAIKFDTHEDILYAKFSKNPELKKILLNTEKKILFECTMDKTFGVGLTLAQRHKLRKNGNPGKNIHGKACMKVRERMREEDIEASCKLSSEDSD